MFLGMANSTNSPLYSIFILSVLLFLLMTSLVISASADPGSEPDPKAPSNSVSAIFVFGDSTSDPGNNNYVTTPFKSNFSPYGRDFPNRIATGRFTNGRLAADFIGMLHLIIRCTQCVLHMQINHAFIFMISSLVFQTDYQ